MKPALAFVIAAFFAVPALAQSAMETPAPERIEAADTADLSTFLWKNRVLLIFADNESDPRFTEQMALLDVRPEDLAERDLVIITDTDPAAQSALREKFRPRGFMLMLIGKDGSVYLRKPRPWSTREISRSIDKMPIRREELRND